MFLLQKNHGNVSAHAALGALTAAAAVLGLSQMSGEVRTTITGEDPPSAGPFSTIELHSEEANSEEVSEFGEAELKYLFDQMKLFGGDDEKFRVEDLRALLDEPDLSAEARNIIDALLADPVLYAAIDTADTPDERPDGKVGKSAVDQFFYEYQHARHQGLAPDAHEIAQHTLDNFRTAPTEACSNPWCSAWDFASNDVLKPSTRYLTEEVASLLPTLHAYATPPSDEPFTGATGLAILITATKLGYPLFPAIYTTGVLSDLFVLGLGLPARLRDAGQARTRRHREQNTDLPHGDAISGMPRSALENDLEDFVSTDESELWMDVQQGERLRDDALLSAVAALAKHNPKSITEGEAIHERFGWYERSPVFTAAVGLGRARKSDPEPNRYIWNEESLDGPVQVPLDERGEYLYAPTETGVVAARYERALADRFGGYSNLEHLSEKEVLETVVGAEVTAGNGGVRNWFKDWMPGLDARSAADLDTLRAQVNDHHVVLATADGNSAGALPIEQGRTYWVHSVQDDQVILAAPFLETRGETITVDYEEFADNFATFSAPTN